MTARRRGRGEGSVTQRHDHPTCPPAVDGTRPDHKCRGRWMATVDLGIIDGKRRRKTAYGATRKEAAMKLQRALAAKEAGTLVVGTMTVEAWLTYWLDVICVERGLKVNSLRSHRSKVENYLIPHLGSIRLDRLQPEDIRAMYAAMRTRKPPLSDATLSQTHAILRRALTVAVRERKTPYNAAEMIDRPQQPRVKRAGLSMDDARKVLTAAGDNPRWFLALYLGMRQGEVLALRWSDVDIEGRVLHVERSLAVLPGGGFTFERPKTAMSKAALPLPTVVASRLAVLRARVVADGATPDDLIFGHDGKPTHPRRDYQQWRDLLNSAEVQPVPLHAARNTTASLLKHLGVSMDDARQILRHASIDMTDHYQADDLGRKRKTVAALEAALSDD